MRTDWDGQGVCAAREGKGEIFQIERKWGDEVEKKMICVKSFVSSLDLTPMGLFTL